MRSWWIILSFLTFCTTVFSQDTVQLELSPAKIKIGEQTKLTLRYTYKADEGKKEIVWPEYKDTITSKIEIVDINEIKNQPADENKDPNLLIQEQSFIVTSFDSGYYAIPPIPVIVNNDTFYSNPILLEVNTVAVDTTKQFKHIKGIYDTDLTLTDYIKLIGNWLKENILWIAIVVILTLLAVYYFYWRHRKKQVVEEPKIIIPPHITAFERLKELENKKLWQNNQIKEYYIELSDILRTYIEERFLINALEQTTDEIMMQLRLTDITEISKLTLVPVLRLADLVKFAKENPVGMENEEMMQRAKDFIQSTLVEEKKKKEE